MLQCRWCVTEEKQLVIRFSILRSQCSAKQPQAGNVSSLNEKQSSTAGTPISHSHCTKIWATLEGPSRPQDPSPTPTPRPPPSRRFFCVPFYFDYRMQSDGVGGGEGMVRVRQAPRKTPRFVACVNRWTQVPFINLGIYFSKYLETVERRWWADNHIKVHTTQRKRLHWSLSLVRKNRVCEEEGLGALNKEKDSAP